MSRYSDNCKLIRKFEEKYSIDILGVRMPKEKDENDESIIAWLIASYIHTELEHYSREEILKALEEVIKTFK